MAELFYIILIGFFVRADGWGTKDPFWESTAIFFDAITCSVLVALVTMLYASPLVALSTGLAFWLFRAPGFHGWKVWLEMLWRGFWPTFIGFTLVSLAAHGDPYYGMLSVPFAGLYMLIYAGGYKWLPETVLGFNRHVWIEHASGWLFAVSILLMGL